MKQKLKPESYETAIVGMMILYFGSNFLDYPSVPAWIRILFTALVVSTVLIRMRKIEGRKDFISTWMLVTTVLLFVAMFIWLYWVN